MPVESLRPEISAEVGLVAETCSSAYVHLDLDVLEPSAGRMNRYAAPHGPSPEDVAWAIGEINQNFFMFAAALTAFDPECDPGGRALHTAIDLALTIIEYAPEREDADE